MSEKYINLIKSFNEEDYRTSVNLHIHTTFSDGEGNAKSFLEQAKAQGFKNIAFADHNTLNNYLENGNLLDEDMVIPAIEFDCWDGTVFLHMLGYGIDVHNEELQAICAKNKRETEADWVRIFSNRHPKNVIQTIHNSGGIAVLAHPACCTTIFLENFVKKLVSYGLDGMEVFYPYKRHRKYIRSCSPNHVKKIAQKYNLIMTGGTDEHTLNLRPNQYFS
ncbi:PHP domain-containing protein [bacterium]|nr:PHP domain-containing protein [bacterium]